MYQGPGQSFPGTWTFSESAAHLLTSITGKYWKSNLTSIVTKTTNYPKVNTNNVKPNIGSSPNGLLLCSNKLSVVVLVLVVFSTFFLEHIFRAVEWLIWQPRTLIYSTMVTDTPEFIFTVLSQHWQWSILQCKIHDSNFKGLKWRRPCWPIVTCLVLKCSLWIGVQILCTFQKDCIFPWNMCVCACVCAGVANIQISADAL